jgi:hypothetical protein
LEEDPQACHSYVFLAEVDGVSQTFPESGSYGFGACEFDSDAAQWLERQEEVQGCGCSSSSIPGLLALWPLVFLATRRQRLGEVSLG